MNQPPKILIVDDDPLNIKYLEQELEDLGFETLSAMDGQEALELVSAEAPDLILLDIMMPVMDGFSVLARLKENEAWRDIPVVVISATNDVQSTVKGIELGAEDYLPKPSDPVLLQARINAGLEKKRFRDQEVEYLRQVKKLTDAALAVETNSFDPQSLSTLAARDDALGHLARVFERMAREVHTREQRLKQQIERLHLDTRERQVAATQTAAAYIPIDRRHALVHGQTLPEKTRGAALFVDISGFVPLTSALAGELGPQRGAEELTRQLDRVYGALIHEVHRYGGSVVNFSGDGITCWFDAGDSDRPGGFPNPAGSTPRTGDGSLKTAGLRAMACALAMQAVMGGLATVLTPAQTAVSPAIKVAVASGPVRRLLVGDPQIQQIEALAGCILDELSMGETLARPGEILVQAALADAADQEITIGDWRSDEASGARFAIVTGLRGDVAPAPWPDSPPGELPDEQARPWLLAPVYDMVHSGRGDFLAELRSVTALFLKFEGLDYEGDDEVGGNLDCFVRWVQTVLARHDGYLVQLTIGDKGSYLLAAFGAPLGPDDHAVRAVAAALEMQAPPDHLDFVTRVQIGLASGQMRVGAYGSQAQRAYGVLGDKTNLAARLMQAANARILCDETVYQAARSHLSFESLPPITLKGMAEPIAVYAPTRENGYTWYKSRIDQLPPGPQLTLKVASLAGSTFSCSMLQAIYPVEADKRSLDENLRILEEQGMVERHVAEPELTYGFARVGIQEAAYNLMLFAQRRQLHRAVAEWYERTYADDAGSCYPLLAHHWRSADEPGKAIHYLEKAAEQARRNGDEQEALRFLNEALEIEAHASVLSDEYHSDFSI
jgi:CheY-like chemotaxis protein